MNFSAKTLTARVANGRISNHQRGATRVERRLRDRDAASARGLRIGSIRREIFSSFARAIFRNNSRGNVIFLSRTHAKNIKDRVHVKNKKASRRAMSIVLRAGRDNHFSRIAIIAPLYNSAYVYIIWPRYARQPVLSEFDVRGIPSGTNIRVDYGGFLLAGGVHNSGAYADVHKTVSGGWSLHYLGESRRREDTTIVTGGNDREKGPGTWNFFAYHHHHHHRRNL